MARFTVLLGFALTAGVVSSQAVEEYQLKAVFLFNVAKFAQWPPGTFRSPKDPIVSCILGSGLFGSALEQAAVGKAIGDREFVVRHVANAREARACQILLIDSSERKRFRAILVEIGAVAVLTAGDSDEFAAAGGMVTFKTKGGKVHLQINLQAAERRGVRISSKVLSLARILKD